MSIRNRRYIAADSSFVSSRLKVNWPSPSSLIGAVLVMFSTCQSTKLVEVNTS